VNVDSFEVVAASMRKNRERAFHLLLGNGFSMAFAPNIFSYNALHDFVSKLDNPVLKELFDVVGTHDFERVMHQLDTFAALGAAFGVNDEVRARVRAAAAELRESLIDGIRALHPEHVFEVPEDRCAACVSFLRPFIESKGSLFTTNYDLLLYWVLMRGGLTAVDGFGRDRENPDEYVPDEELEYSELRWGRNLAGQNVFYIHGALPLFDTGVEIVKEEYTTEAYLLQRIAARIDAGEYPVFVTAGDGTQKLTHIRHNPYLEHCYKALSSIDGSLVTFGFNFGAQDSHILSALQKATHGGKKVPPRLWSVYVGVYSQADRDRGEELAAELKCKVRMFDARTAPVWR
jgi:hypothetical protein